MATSWVIELDRADLDYAVLGTLALAALTAWLLFRVGLLGWALRLLGGAVRGSVRLGFALWERTLSWAPWPLFFAVAVGLLLTGGVAAAYRPGLTVACAVAALFMGVAACLAYMFIDLERYEVERGYKAIHNPLKGQELARHLARYGHRVGVPLLAAATVAAVGGFALLNEGLYLSVGRDWYRLGEGEGAPGFVDFLVNALLHLLRVVDVLDLANSHHLLNARYVRQAAWPAATLLGTFKAFFTLVLLQQIFASVRQGKLLAETITDFWSPHEPIHERARNALPQYGAAATGPLLLSLRSVEALTKEQRGQLPLVLATIGPTAVPVLLRHLDDPHPHVRAVAVATLGHLRAQDAVRLLGPMARDPSDMVRQAVAEALGTIVGAGAAHRGTKRRLRRLVEATKWGTGRLLWWRRAPAAPPSDPTEVAVPALLAALDDASAGVRGQAALALGHIGPVAGPARLRLIALLADGDETVRCRAAEALGQVGGPPEPSVAALVELLADASVPVRASAARALGGLKEGAAAAVSSLAVLLQDTEESVRTAAAEAVKRIGTLDAVATDTLVEGLGSRDNMVRAQTAEALGEIGAPAQEAAPALVEVLRDKNDVVRARAVEALGKIGNGAAEVAVPGLVRALRDPDNWVSALAAEALGQMADAAEEAVPALVRSLGHVNPLVRGNAAEALGRMGARAGPARPALERASRDEDGGVRSPALGALGALGSPTATSAEAVRAGLQDADPRVRAAAVSALGAWGGEGGVTPQALLALLDDSSDQVKVEVTRVLPRLAGVTPEVVEGLCRSLRDDGSPLIHEHAAAALGKLGPAAAAAGGALLRAAQTGDVSVRESALRALALIQPPEAARAFATGLQDASADVRKVASAGWMKSSAIPEEVIPVLVQALGDPETQVRANAAHALARLDSLPPEAVPRLAECAADASDGLRINAALALRSLAAGEALTVMEHLLGDPNPRVRLIAARALLARDAGHEGARAVVLQALGDPVLKMRKAALELVEALGENAGAFAGALHERVGREEDATAAQTLARLLDRLAPRAGTPSA
jgi:HEAT repeat protein